MREKKPFLKHIHYFRAFAIINIVILHTWHAPASAKTAFSTVNIIRELLFHSSTIYFIFISGFLFYYLSERFVISRYYKSKLLNVIFPYTFLTSLVLIAHKTHLLNNEYSSYPPEMHPLLIFVYGKAQWQYWYIPFVTLIFIVSPLLLKLPIIRTTKFFILLSILPLFGTRTETEITLGQYLYFFPIYIQGMYIAMNYSTFISTIKRHKSSILFCVLLSSTLIAYFHTNPCTYGMFNPYESLHYIQKCSIGLLALLILYELEDKHFPLLNSFATYSFAIYFTHTVIRELIPTYQYFQLFGTSEMLIFFASIAYATVITFITLYVCIGLKKILGKYSRFFIGA